ncbi:MAG: cytochrome P450 [Streptosporangiales bacterium]|nr:cytochrome P450 [Streptosporangiales bacterium]
MAFWVRPLPEREAAFSLLRQYRPVPFYPEPDLGWLEPGPGYYALTRHEDIVEASRQPEVFSSAKGATSVADTPEDFLEFFGSMINLDDPRHARLRRIVSQGFTPRMIKKLEDDVQRAAALLVDDVIDRGECDFVTEIAARLPLKIICDMMGVPERDYDFVFDRSNVILGSQDPEYIPEGGDVPTVLLTAGAELSEMVQELARHRVANPTDDLTSALVNANIDGEQLTTQELGSFFVLLVVAGNETTRNAISHGLWLLTQHPDQRDLWASDFEAYAPTAVEEIVRVASPVIWMRRTLTRDHELNGHRFAEGDKVLLMYWSANRDETIFDDPYTFDITRSPNPHVGFGGPGPHYCLGAHLARREITVMFRELLRRVPDIHASGEPSRLQSTFINGIKHLPCTFTGKR